MLCFREVAHFRICENHKTSFFGYGIQFQLANNAIDICIKQSTMKHLLLLPILLLLVKGSFSQTLNENEGLKNDHLDIELNENSSPTQSEGIIEEIAPSNNSTDMNKKNPRRKLFSLNKKAKKQYATKTITKSFKGKRKFFITTSIAFTSLLLIGLMYLLSLVASIAVLIIILLVLYRVF